MKAKQWIMALLCVALILGQIYFDLRLPDYMSDLTVQIKTPGSTVSDVLHTGLEMLACTLISAVMAILYIQLSPKYNRVAGAPAQAAGNNDLDNELD